MDQNTKVITDQLINELVNYLAIKPYMEVHKLITQLVTLPSTVSETPPVIDSNPIKTKK